MKKLIALTLLVIFATAGAFALDMAIGGGVLFNYSNTSGSIDMYPSPGNADWDMDRTGFGAFAFFGISRFWEFNLGYLYKSPGTMTVRYQGNSGTVDAKDEGIENTGALQLGAYFKYPFVLTESIVLFPTVGVDYEITLSSNPEWWNDFWFRGGVGMDFFFSESVFLRGHLIYGAAIPVGGDKDLGLDFTHGFLAKLGVGWMF